MGVEEMAEHTKRTLCHRVEQDAECLFGGGLCVGATVALAESRIANFAFVPLFSRNESIFNKPITPTLLARQHNTTSMKNRRIGTEYNKIYI